MYSKKISVILPIYNVKPYIKQALDSLINQTFKDLEIICVDDCSTDGTIEILREYTQKDERIKLVELKENKGQGNARNIAIDMAQGEYVMFLDPDDWYELNACELAYNQITKNDNDFVMFGFKQYYEETGKSKVMTYWLEPFKSVLEQPKINLLDLKNDFIQNAFSVCRIYKKEFLDKYNIRYSNDRIDQDNIFIINAFISAKDISILNEPVYNYRINKKSTTFKINLWKEMINARRKSYELVKERQVDSKYMEAFLTYTISALLYWYKQLSMMDKDAVKDFYDNIKEFFIQLKKEQNFDNIDSKLMERFEIFIKNDSSTYESNLRKKRIKAFFRNIFSVTNSAWQNKKIKHKIITVLGLKFKFKINQEKILRKQYNNIQNNYKNVLKRIRNKCKNGEKIKVVFLSNECQKWVFNSLYQIFDKSKQFEPIVAVFPRFRNGKIDTTALSVEKNIEYYKSLNIKTVNLYKNEQIHDLKELNPDIVFYQQKPGLLGIYNHNRVSEYALTMFSSYGYEIEDLKVNYSPGFHQLMFKYFTEHQYNVERYKTYNKKAAQNLVVTGYPRLDLYLNKTQIDLNNYWREPQKYKVLYAPHYSIVKAGEQGYALSTFLENGKLILELAKEHPETTWVFKPHPRLAYELVMQNAWSEKEVENYYKEWEKIGNVYMEGNCIDLFKTSDLMLTDSSAFLAEYLPSKHPVIWMKRKDRSELNSIGKKITNTYYQSNNNEELKELFNELVVNKNDYKKEERLNIIPEIIDFNKSCADKIYEYIIKILNNEDNE